jgi:HEAT repeat protein
MNRSILGLLIGLRSIAILHAQPNPAPAPPVPPRAPVRVNVDQLEIQSRIDMAMQKAGGRGEDRNYRNGTRALDRSEWDKAAEAFSAVIQEKGQRVEGAYYWKAYALGKSGKRDEAVTLLNELEKSYPKSRWLDDARALRVELRQAAGQPLSADVQNDEELKLIALNGLVDTAPDRAIPAIRELLKKSSSPRLRERALFVLAQSDSAPAREILAQYAKGSGNPDLQLKAVEYLGMHRRKENLPLLSEIYNANPDIEIRRRVLRAYMMQREKEPLLQAARTEKDPDLRREAVMMLGGMRADTELMQLYSSETDREVRRHIIHAVMSSKSPKSLVEIARKETDPDLKKEAVRMLSNMKSQEATDYLMELVNK